MLPTCYQGSTTALTLPGRKEEQHVANSLGIGPGVVVGKQHISSIFFISSYILWYIILYILLYSLRSFYITLYYLILFCEMLWIQWNPIKILWKPMKSYEIPCDSFMVSWVSLWASFESLRVLLESPWATIGCPLGSLRSLRGTLGRLRPTGRPSVRPNPKKQKSHENPRNNIKTHLI